MSQLSRLVSPGRHPVALALLGVAALGLAGCGGKERPRADLAASQVTTIGVNSYLWRASLDALSFMPLLQADGFRRRSGEGRRAEPCVASAGITKDGIRSDRAGDDDRR